jgi:hypothetical protein
MVVMAYAQASHQSQCFDINSGRNGKTTTRSIVRTKIPGEIVFCCLFTFASTVPLLILQTSLYCQFTLYPPNPNKMSCIISVCPLRFRSIYVYCYIMKPTNSYVYYTNDSFSVHYISRISSSLKISIWCSLDYIMGIRPVMQT